MSESAVFRLTGSGRSKSSIEGSVRLRIAISATLLIAMVAVLAQQIMNTQRGVVAVTLVMAGSFVAWRRRNSKQVSLKIVLAAALLMAFANFLSQVSGAASIDDTRGPLAEIFLWVAALHSFDQPRRKDLQFSVAASVAMMALGGSVSLGASYLIYFIPWAGAALLSLLLTYESEARDLPEGAVLPRLTRPQKGHAKFPALRSTVILLLVLLGVTSLVFLFAPRGRGMHFENLPFSIPSFIPVPSGVGVVNRGLPNADAPGPEPAQPKGDSYFGFANFVDLRVRGKLSNRLIMRVRAAEPAFWRGAVFDTYANNSWSSLQSHTKKLGGLPVEIPSESETERFRPGPTQELTQTFYVESGQSNVIFAAYEPRELWFPGGGRIDITDESVARAGFVLDEGLVYSVVSNRPSPTRSDLDVTTASIPGPILRRYLQIPDTLPARVKTLASQVANSEPTIVGKVEAIEHWMKENTRYKLDLPPQPPGTDAVDHFLFEDRRGFCEHIASAMVLLLRSQGVPARFVTGYDPGSRNIFSGYFEVRAKDAHSWVEVFYPGVGWMQYDPTHVVPVAAPSGEQFRAPGLDLFGKTFENLKNLFPRDSGARIARAFQGFFSSIIANGPLFGGILMAIAGLLTGGSFLIRRFEFFRDRSALRRLLKQPRAMTPAQAFSVVEEAGQQSGISRALSSTASEYASRLATFQPSIQDEDLQLIIEELERYSYGGVTDKPLYNRDLAEAASRVSSKLLVVRTGSRRMR